MNEWMNEWMKKKERMNEWKNDWKDDLMNEWGKVCVFDENSKDPSIIDVHQVYCGYVVFIVSVIA